MGFTEVEGDKDSIEEVDEVDASSTIIVSFDFSNCTNTAATNRRLIRSFPFLDSVFTMKVNTLLRNMIVVATSKHQQGGKARGKRQTSVLLCTSLYFLVLPCTSLYFIVLHCTSLYFMYFSVLHCTSLYFIVLRCTSLYFMYFSASLSSKQNKSVLFMGTKVLSGFWEFPKTEHFCSIFRNRIFLFSDYKALLFYI